MDMAEARYPGRWYHDVGRGNRLAFMVGITLYLPRFFWEVQFPTWLRVGLIILIGLGVVADIATTLRVMRFKAAFDQRELPFPIFELNPFLPDVPTLRDMLLSRNMLIWVTVIGVAFVYPELGVSVLVMHLPVCLGNLRQATILAHMLTLYDQSYHRKIRPGQSSHGT